MNTPPPRTTRGVEPKLRRARLLAMRLYSPGSLPRKGIRSGHWDGGKVVGQFLPAKKETGDGR